MDNCKNKNNKLPAGVSWVEWTKGDIIIFLGCFFQFPQGGKSKSVTSITSETPTTKL